MVRPCGECPFRTDHPGYLGAERMRDIAGGILKDDYSFFTCHMTPCVAKDEHGEEYEVPETLQQCAGSAIFLLLNGRPNILTRIGQQLNQGNARKLDLTAPVASTLKEIVDHHS